MKKLLLIVLVIIISFTAGWIVKGLYQSNRLSDVTDNFIEKPQTPFDKYTIENLVSADIPEGKLDIVDEIDDEENYESKLFEFRFLPSLDNQTKTTTGQINIPKNEAGDNQKYPIIIMLRGYVDQEKYRTGDGTRNAAAYFADNDYITVAPDFLGYGESDSEAGNIFEARFQTYITVVSLIKSLDQIRDWNGKDIAVWGHSNGGHIAITVLEITGASYPTVLWAPVSKQFPYSVLYYTDQSVDGGKLIRNELAKFEQYYDVDKYSLTNYLDRINASIQLHQGTADDAVPYEWSRSFYTKLEASNKEIEYDEYPDADHNLRPVWDKVVEKSLQFYNLHLSD